MLAQTRSCTSRTRTRYALLALSLSCLASQLHAAAQYCASAASTPCTPGAAMVEYQETRANGRYFITACTNEIAAVDGLTSGPNPLFRRTGLTIPVFAPDVPGALGLSRFQLYIPDGTISHFYTGLPGELTGVDAHIVHATPSKGCLDSTATAYWQLPTPLTVEALVDPMRSACPAATAPIWRMLRISPNNSSLANHRFTTSFTLAKAMAAADPTWSFEGVKGCARDPSATYSQILSSSTLTAVPGANFDLVSTYQNESASQSSPLVMWSVLVPTNVIWDSAGTEASACQSEATLDGTVVRCGLPAPGYGSTGTARMRFTVASAAAVSTDLTFRSTVVAANSLNDVIAIAQAPASCVTGDTPSLGCDVHTLFSTSSANANVSLAVTPQSSDIAVAAGTPLTTTFDCTNVSTANTARGVTCAASIPAGSPFSVSCSPSPTVSAQASAVGVRTAVNLDPREYIRCTITGYPTASDVGGRSIQIATTADNATTQSATITINVTRQSSTPAVRAYSPPSQSVAIGYAITPMVFSCMNTSSVSVSNAACTVTGASELGLTTSCAPSARQTSLGSAGKIDCTVTGAPSKDGEITVTAGATGAFSNWSSATISRFAATTIIEATAAQSQTITIGDSIATMTFTCANVGKYVATAASCLMSVPSGLNVVCSPAATGTWAPGAKTVCTVTGKPIAIGMSSLTIASAALNAPSSSASATLTVKPPPPPVLKVTAPAAQTVYEGSPITPMTFTCTNTGPSVAENASCTILGASTLGLTSSCAPSVAGSMAVGASATCSVTGTPTASGPISVQFFASNALEVPGATVLVTLTPPPAPTIAVTAPANMTAIVGSAITPLTFTCTNTSNYIAKNATCMISGAADAGLNSVCETAPNGILGAKKSLVCTVSGIPYGPARISVTMASVGANSVSASTLVSAKTQTARFTIEMPAPVEVALGQAVSMSVVCSNTSGATAPKASCVINGLAGTGLTSNCTPTVPVTSLAPGASITCQITGTPSVSVAFTATASDVGGSMPTTSPSRVTVTRLSSDLRYSAAVVVSSPTTLQQTVAANAAIAPVTFGCQVSPAAPADLSCDFVGARELGLDYSCTASTTGGVACSLSGVPSASGTFLYVAASSKFAPVIVSYTVTKAGFARTTPAVTVTLPRSVQAVAAGNAIMPIVFLVQPFGQSNNISSLYLTGATDVGLISQCTLIATVAPPAYYCSVTGIPASSTNVQLVAQGSNAGPSQFISSKVNVVP